MANIRAPKQWSLTKIETITSFEAWRQNLLYVLSLDINFAPFLTENAVWLKKTARTPIRGFLDDSTISDMGRRTAAQKITHLELMLGQIANYCPVISRNTIVKNSTSITSIWQAIRLHYGFQSTGAHFIDFNYIQLEPGEKPEDLFQRLNSFIEDNLLLSEGNITHHGTKPDVDEDLSPSLENMVVLTWLRLLHRDLPALVKQRYGTELRSQTLASLKPEISQALGSLLEEIHSSADVKILRSTFQRHPSSSFQRHPSSPSQRHHNQGRPHERRTATKKCPLCIQAGRAKHQHFLSQCKFLPEEDRLYLTKARNLTAFDDEEENNDQQSDSSDHEPAANNNSNTYNYRVVTSRRVSTKQSPIMKVFFRHLPLQLTLDSGAETSMIKYSIAQQLGTRITKSKQKAFQADGITPLAIVGETCLSVTRNGHDLILEALVVDNLDVDVLAGTPFMTTNDVAIRPAKQQIILGGNDIIYYGSELIDTSAKDDRHHASVLRTTSSTVVWPEQYVEVQLPSNINPNSILSVEPRFDSSQSHPNWPPHQLIESVSGKIRIVNNSHTPYLLRKHEHFCQVRYTCSATEIPIAYTPPRVSIKSVSHNNNTFYQSDTVQLDPDNILPGTFRSQFQAMLRNYETVFQPDIPGYNGSVGPFQAVVNMGPVQPPQRKGRVPQYSKDKLVELQQQFDDLESQGVFKRPEDAGITVEYLNPSFLVKKPSGGYRLVTAFADVGRYSKPQPSLMPDVDSILRNIARWKYIIVTDLTKAFYQIPLAKNSMKYCGVATPFRGVRVYTRCAMGMPGSETALEELMCRVLGDCLQDGIAAKLADDLYCGADNPTDLLKNWHRILESLRQCNLRLSPTKTIICPKSTTILGWVWSEGRLSASPHRIAVLSSCPPPTTAHGLRSFIGAYKVLSRVLPDCSHVLSPLENAVASLQSSDKIPWSDTLNQQFNTAQHSLHQNKSIVLPKPADQLWIVTDGSVTKQGLGATLYVTRNKKLSLAGFYSAKLRKHQVTWLPCEIEALSITAAIKHFSPFIIQSDHKTHILTDSQPCVQAFEKLCRGEFSASPRITSFLSIASRYQADLHHLAGKANVPSDFTSRNAPDCHEPRCQICCFITQTEDSVVRPVSVQDVQYLQRLPFTTRSAWRDIQSECPDLRRTHAHLKQGTRPSKKLTNIKDVKRYLNVVSIDSDGLLVVRRNTPLAPSTSLIVVPRTVLDGLVTALHIKLDHPSKHQLKQVMQRHFYSLNLDQAISQACDSCHTCASLRRFPPALSKQHSEDPPETVGISFAADVLKRYRQNILVLRETATSFTSACIISDEKHATLRDALASLCVGLHPLDGPPPIIRVDPAPGFVALRDDPILSRLRICLEIGRTKNVNKNPVADKAIYELEDELLRQEPGGGPITSFGLALAIARLNSRIRGCGVSARELWTQRSQFTHDNLPVDDRQIITAQHEHRLDNHPYSEKSKCHNPSYQSRDINIGDLVYLYSDRDKSHGRDRYLVVAVDDEWCKIKKFSGNQLRASSYKVRLSECYLVPSNVTANRPYNHPNVVSEDEDSIQITPPDTLTPTAIPSSLSLPASPKELPTCPSPVSSPKKNGVVSQPSQSTPVQETVLSDPPPLPSPHEEITVQAPLRPQRNRRPPKYLDDYVRS